MSEELVATVSPEGVLQRTSPSAIETFTRCETAWWLRYVAHEAERIRRAIVLAQQMGTAAHAQLEAYGKGGAYPTDLLALALLQYMPAVGPGLLLETHTNPLLYIAGVSTCGRIDLTHDYVRTRPLVGDWKTRSDLDKYQKTEAELKHDVQMNCYAAWAWLQYPDAELVDVAHYYVETKHHKNKETGAVECQRCSPPDPHCRKPQHAPRTSTTMVTFNRNDTAREMLFLESTVKRMKLVAAFRSAQDAGHPTDFISSKSPCNAFAGCGYKHACPHHPLRSSGESSNKLFADLVGKTGAAPMADSLTDLLNARRAAAQAAAPVQPPKPPPAPAPANDGTADGFVVDSVSRRGLIGAVVSMGALATVTNEKGYYKLVGLPVGAVVTLTAEKEGYKPLTASAGPLEPVVPARAFFDMKPVATDAYTTIVGEAPVTGGILRPEVPYVETKADPLPPPRVPTVQAEPIKYAREALDMSAAKDVAATRTDSTPPLKLEHVHCYNPDKDWVCACGAKKRGRRPSQPPIAPTVEAEIVTKAEPQPAPEPQPEPAPEPPEPVPEPQPVQRPVAVHDTRTLLVNCYAARGGFTDLTEYVNNSAKALAEKGIGPGHSDPRFVDNKQNPLAYGGWRGALAEYAKNNPPAGDRWVLWTGGNELAECVAQALSALSDVETITGR